MAEEEWLDVITDSLDMSLSKLREMVKDREPGMLQRVTRSWTRLRDGATMWGWTHLSSRLFRDPHILTPGPANPTE